MVVRQKYGAFFMCYIKRQERFLQFQTRLKEHKRHLENLERMVSDVDFRDSLLNGVSFHATWKEGDCEVPTLQRSKYYLVVKTLDSEERMNGKKYSMMEVEARLALKDLENDTVAPRRLARPASDSALKTGGAFVKSKDICYSYNKKDGCTQRMDLLGRTHH